MFKTLRVCVESPSVLVEASVCSFSAFSARRGRESAYNGRENDLEVLTGLSAAMILLLEAVRVLQTMRKLEQAVRELSEMYEKNFVLHSVGGLV